MKTLSVFGLRLSSLALSVALLAWAMPIHAHTVGVTEAPMTILDARDRLLSVDYKLIALQHQVEKATADHEAAQSLHGPKVDLTFKEVWGTKTLDMNVDTGAQARLAQLEAMARPAVSQAINQGVQSGAIPPTALPALAAIGKTAGELANHVASQINTLHFQQRVSLNGPRLVLEVNWPLYTGGLISAQLHQLNELINVSDAKRRQAHLEEEAQLILLYYGVQLLRDQVEIRTQLENDARALRDKAKRMVEVGTLSKVQSLGAEVAYQNAKTETENARTQLVAQEAKLESLLDLTNLPPLASPLEAPDLPSGTVEGFIAQSEASHPVLAEVRAQLGRADAGIDAAQAQYLPKVGFFAQKNLIKRFLSINEPDWVAGIGVTMTLWSDKDRRAQMRSAQAQRNAVLAMENQARSQLRQAIVSSFSTMHSAFDQLARLPETVALATENLKLKTQQFNVGLATVDDVNTARTQLAAAQLAQKAAIYQYLGSRVQLAVAVGNTDPLFTQLTPRTRGSLP